MIYYAVLEGNLKMSSSHYLEEYCAALFDT